MLRSGFQRTQSPLKQPCIVSLCCVLFRVMIPVHVRIMHKSTSPAPPTCLGATKNVRDGPSQFASKGVKLSPFWKSQVLQSIDLGETKGIEEPIQIPLAHQSSFSTASLADISNTLNDAMPVPMPYSSRQGYHEQEIDLPNDGHGNTEPFPEFEDMDGLQRRRVLLRIIFEARSSSQAWDAYEMLLAMKLRPSDLVEPGKEDRSGRLVIPYIHLHKLARLLSQTRPRTRQVYLRLLSVLTTLRSSGGLIKTWEWNALLNCAGKGWRKTSVDDYRAAVDIFKEMLASNPSAYEVSGRRRASTSRKVAEPDIFTFTTLLDIASRSLSDQAIRHAMSLLSASQLPWNNVTHLVRLPYLVHSNQLAAVLDILATRVAEGLLDIVTINASLWAFAYKGKLRMVMQAYYHLRHNVPEADHVDTGDPDVHSFTLDDNPFLKIPGFMEQATMPPDEKTYTLLIQALCYHGDLVGALTVFRDMVSTVKPYPGKERTGEKVAPQTYFQPTLAIYRGIFLGFARHAGKKSRKLSDVLSAARQGIDLVPLPEFAARLTASSSTTGFPSPNPEEYAESPWTVSSLDKLFDHFLELPDDPDGPPTKPSDRTIYWLMVAYAGTTKGDINKMYKTWRRLSVRFNLDSPSRRLGGRLVKIGSELERRQEQHKEHPTWLATM